MPAIHEPCQRWSGTGPCLVMGFGKPIRVNVSFVQPVSATSSTASPAARGTQRRGWPARPRREAGRLGVNEMFLPGGCLGLSEPVLTVLLQRVVETVSRL